MNLVDSQSIFDLKEPNSTHVMGLSTESTSETLGYEKMVKDLGINLDDSNLSKEQKEKLYSWVEIETYLQRTCLS